MKFCWGFVSGPLLLLIGSCGGPSQQAKVATAIESMLSNIVSGNIEIVAGRATIGSALPCPDGGTYQAVNPQYGTFNPSNPSATPITTSIVYNQCQLKICGDTLTLSGNQATSVTLSISNGTANQISLQLSWRNEIFDGFISGPQSFDYVMNATASTTSLGTISFSDASPPNPLVLNGTTYNAIDISALSDGC